MAQNRTLDYGAPRRSSYLNRRHTGVIPAGIFSGYTVRATTPESLALSIAAGKLITADGVTIEETAELVGVVTIAPHETLPRIDWIVATHDYSTSNTPQEYSVVEGTAGAPPLPPALPANSIKLASVYVPAAAVSITDLMIANAPTVNADASRLGRSRLEELLVVPAAESGSGFSDKVFIYGGTILASNGLASVPVLDQESASFDPIASGAGYDRYDLVTVDDNGAVDIVKGTEDIGSVAAVPPPYPNDKQVVAEVHIDEQGTAGDPVLIKAEDIRDVRFFFNLAAASASSAMDRTDFETTTGQTEIPLTFSYTPGQNQLIFSYGGALMTVGVDYDETDGTTITSRRPLRSGVNCSVLRNRTELGS